MADHRHFPLPHGGRGQGEGACNPPASNITARMRMRISAKSGVLRHPLTPTLSPGGGEGVALVLVATHA